MTNRGKKYGHRYPWASWFEQAEFRLVQGRDYRYRTDSMAQQVRNAAGRLGKRVSISISDAGDSLTVRVLD